MGDETGKQNLHVFMFFVGPKLMHRVSSVAIIWCFVYAGVSFELGGHWGERVLSLVNPIHFSFLAIFTSLRTNGQEMRIFLRKEKGFLRRVFDPQACQPTGA